MQETASANSMRTKLSIQKEKICEFGLISSFAEISARAVKAATTKANNAYLNLFENIRICRENKNKTTNTSVVRSTLFWWNRVDKITKNNTTSLNTRSAVSILSGIPMSTESLYARFFEYTEMQKPRINKNRANKSITIVVVSALLFSSPLFNSVNDFLSYRMSPVSILKKKIINQFALITTLCRDFNLVFV